MPPLIPARIWWNEIWQESLLFSSFWCLIIQAELDHSRIETRMFHGIHRNGIQLFGICCFFLSCLLPNKHNTLLPFPPTNRENPKPTMTTTHDHYPHMVMNTHNGRSLPSPGYSVWNLCGIQGIHGMNVG